MQLDFAEIKRIRIAEVCARYRVQLRFSGRAATAVCPLPTHKKDDKERTFSIEMDRNFFQCFSASCNRANGGKRGGDVIDFVALMENCRPREAAEKLAEWHGMAAPREHASVKPAPTSAASGYMASVDAWWEELRQRRDGEDDATFWHRVLTGVKSKLLESYRNGRSQQSAA